MPAMGRGMEVIKLLKKWQQVTKFKLAQERDKCSFLIGTMPFKIYGEQVKEIRSVIRPYSHPMSMSKELYNKLLAIKKKYCKTF
jgi:hypothetical protein